VADIVITIPVAVFLAGIVMGVIVIVCVSIRQGERDFLRTGVVSMTRRACSLFSAGAGVSFPVGSASEHVRAYQTGGCPQGRVARAWRPRRRPITRGRCRG
jgi:hypothetical protein